MTWTTGRWAVGADIFGNARTGAGTGLVLCIAEDVFLHHVRTSPYFEDTSFWWQNR
jgi:hypothetical protein